MLFKIIHRLKMAKVIFKTGAPSHEVVVETLLCKYSGEIDRFGSKRLRRVT